MYVLVFSRARTYVYLQRIRYLSTFLRTANATAFASEKSHLLKIINREENLVHEDAVVEEKKIPNRQRAVSRKSLKLSSNREKKKRARYYVTRVHTRNLVEVA